MTIADLQGEYFKVLEKYRDYEEAVAGYNAKLATYLREQGAPIGYNADIFGTGKLLPDAQCRMIHDPNKG